LQVVSQIQSVPELFFTQVSLDPATEQAPFGIHPPPDLAIHPLAGVGAKPIHAVLVVIDVGALAQVFSTHLDVNVFQ
jgi:hypothetical protein